MNKTININLGGIFFHIDELAYQKLKLYLDAIRRSLSDDPQGRDEILNDIELRIGELLNKRITDPRQVVNEQDIDEITKIMGKPEDYMVDEEMFDDVPNYRRSSAQKRLFRDPDDKFIGGVCSGLSHYFGFEPIWVRIVALILLFGFGIGFIIYPILWILIPEASTTADKLQMKGEPVNIDNIERTIRAEFRDVTNRVNDGVNSMTEKVRDSEFRKNVNEKAKSGMQDLIDTLGKFFTALFKVLGKFIGVLLIIIAASTLIGLLFGGISWGGFELGSFGDRSDFVYPPFFYDNLLPVWLIVAFTLILVAIPFIFILWLGLRIVSKNVKPMGTAAKSSLIGIWVVALLGLGFSGLSYESQTAYYGISNQTEQVNIAPNDTLYVRMKGNDDLATSYREMRRRYNSEVIVLNGTERLYSTRIDFDVKQTNNEKAYLKIRKESRGKNRVMANEFAESIEYKFNLTDKELSLDGFFLSDVQHKYKDQMVDITLYLPTGSIVYFDRSTRTYLDAVDNVQNIYDRDMPSNYFIMREFELECLDCDPSIFSEAYKREHGNFNLKIDEEGVEININDEDENANIKIDEKGLRIN